MSRVNVRPLAETDVAEAYEWYEQQGAGLGEQFLDEVQAVYDHIEQFPAAFPEVYRDARRALVRRFPYAVFYRLRDNTAHILACEHVRRHPRAWRDRV